MLVDAGASPMGIFGGTFDPIHYGHLRTAFELLHALELGQVRFMPCGQPPHREQPVAPGRARLAMVQAACAGQAGFLVDDRELRRQGPSYTVDTLAGLRSEFPHRPLCLLVGMDAFLGLPRWHEWRRILQLAHLVVAKRPGWQAPVSGTLAELLAERGTVQAIDLHRARAGAICIHPVTQLEISSTGIRQMAAAGQLPRYLTPDPVCRIIDESGCYRTPRNQEDENC